MWPYCLTVPGFLNFLHLFGSHKRDELGIGGFIISQFESVRIGYHNLNGFHKTVNIYRDLSLGNIWGCNAYNIFDILLGMVKGVTRFIGDDE